MSRLATASILAGVLFAALALRVAAGLLWQQRLPAGEPFVFGDSSTYWELGRTIARGEAYRYLSDDAKVFRTPGYPLLLAGLFAVRDRPPVLWGRLLSACLLTLGVGGVYCLGRLMFDARTGLLAAAVAACYPGLIVLGALVLSEAPFCALLPWQIICWQRGWLSKRLGAQAGWFLATGAIAGLMTLVRPSWLLFAPFALVCGLLLSGARCRHLFAALGILPALAAVMLPWWVRNHQVTGRFVPTTLQVGASLYDGLNPAAYGGSNMDFVPEMKARLEAAQAHPAAEAPLEYRLDRMLRRAAFDWAAEHPGRALQLAAVKFGRMWNVWPNHPQFRHPLAMGAIFCSYVPAMVLAGVGVWQLRHRGWPIALCLLPAVYLTLLHMVFVSSIRYRLPPMLPLIVLAAAVIVRQCAERRESSSM